MCLFPLSLLSAHPHEARNNEPRCCRCQLLVHGPESLISNAPGLRLWSNLNPSHNCSLIHIKTPSFSTTPSNISQTTRKSVQGTSRFLFLFSFLSDNPLRLFIVNYHRINITRHPRFDTYTFNKYLHFSVNTQYLTLTFLCCAWVSSQKTTLHKKTTPMTISLLAKYRIGAKFHISFPTTANTHLTSFI